MGYKDALLGTKLENKAGSPSWLWDLREKAFAKFKTLGFPRRNHESWRYLDLEPILGSAFLAGEGALGAVPDRAARGYFLPDAENRLVFVNGRFSEALSSVKAAKGLTLMNLERALREKGSLLKDHLGVSSADEENPFAEANTFSFRDGAFVHAEDHMTLEAPIHLLFIGAGTKDAPVFYPRILVSAGKCARVKLIADFVGAGDAPFFSNAVAEVFLGEGACLNFFQVQRSGAGAIRFSTNRFYLKKLATLNAFSFAQGGAVTRNEASVDYGGEGGFASLKGLGVMKDGSQIFNHVSALHHTPQGTSRQFYKMILGGRARSEFNSLVRVPGGAQKTNSHQMSRNLLLSGEAQAYARPQLRIDTDDVVCVHGATVGQLQKDELFYLRSRGIPEKDARFLMTYGFAEEILEEMPEDLRPALEDFVQKELKGMIG
jgi:Fe-S cluster assembly protein SufD